MKKIIFILVPFLLSAFAFLDNRQRTEIGKSTRTCYDVTSWTVNGRQVLLNGTPFFAKGIGYQPVPVGEHPNDYPNGDYFMLKYAYIYKPDIDKMRDMGVNAIKIYSWYPDEDHSDFLNYAYNGGNNPIYVLVGYYMPPGTIIGQFDEKLKLFKQLAEKTKTHPGIMGYQLGNENVGNDTYNPDFWNKLNQISSALKSIAPNKLTTTGLVDDGMKSVKAGNNSMTSLDVWGINLFRGKTLGDFYSTYENVSTKPAFITELGFPATVRTNGIPQAAPNNGADVADYSEAVMDEIYKNRSKDDPSDAVSGVFWFMFCDEWWKQECPACYGNPCTCSKSTHDFTLSNYTDNFPGKYWDEEWFGLYTADRQPRAAVDVLKSIWKK